MKKRVISLLLAAVMIFALVGCGGGGGKSSSSDDFDNAPVVRYAVMNSYEKKLGAAGDDPFDNPYIRYIYEKTGIRVEPVLLSSNDSEASQQLAVKRAGGEQIDLILDWDIRQAYMQAGLTIPLNDLLEKYKKLIPNLLANIPEEAWNGLSKRGEIWGIPGRYVFPTPDIRYIFVRKDWMDKLGLEMPTTTDELGEVMRAFTEDDPDGNGVKDTYAFVHKGDNTVNSLLRFFGCDSWNETYVNGRFENGAMTDRARKALGVLRKWDKAGYINHDGIADIKAHDNLVSSNKAGMIIGSPDVPKYNTALHANGFTEAEWALCNTQIVSSEDGIFWGYSQKGKNHASATSITSMAKDYESIFKLLNWIYSEEGTFFTSYGLEGREYNMVDGKPQRDENYVNEKSYLGMFNFGKSYNHYYEDLAYAKYGNDEFAKEYVNEVLNNYDFYIGEKPISTAIKFDYPDLKEFTDYPDWRKGVSSNMMKFVAGDLDPADDATWQKYIDECNSYGLRKLLDAALEAYNNDTERTDKIDLEEYFK